VGSNLGPSETAGSKSFTTPATATGRLNQDQQQAVLHSGARLLIVAGPGTGKTHTLTARIAHLITARQVLPEHILAVTFTNKAAEEMCLRLRTILGGATALPLVDTFHGLCLSLLQELNPEEDITIIDEYEQSELIAEAAGQATESGIPVSLKLSELQDRIMRAKQNLLAPPRLAQTDPNATDDKGFGAAYRAYQQLLHSQRMADFEDLIFRVAYRLETDCDFRQTCRDRFRHVFVDEYQDLNHAQYRIIHALAPVEANVGSLCVIGDPDQCIYGFRGSDPRYFYKFLEAYPEASVVTLSRNYRSTDTILSASQQIIARGGSDPPRVYSNIEGIKTIRMLELPNEHAEAESIARIIESLVGGSGFHSLDTGRVKDGQGSSMLGYGDFAVLIRTRDQLRILADGFNKCGIPFQAASRCHLYKRKGIIELVSLLKLVSGIGGYSDVERVAAVISPEIGKKVLQSFKQWAFKNRLAVKDALSAAVRFPIPALRRGHQLQLVDFVERISAIGREAQHLRTRDILIRLKETPGISRLLDDDESQEALKRLEAQAESSGVEVKGFLAHSALQNDTDVYHPRAEKTALMTMHAAKGLEFPVVFIAGCETGFIPFQREDQAPEDMNEERRLFYVAMTRARQRLYLTRAKCRRVFGKTEKREASIFINDIEETLLKDESPRGKLRKPKADQLQLF
jgi:superfamily I DNA/RNA helicase